MREPSPPRPAPQPGAPTQSARASNPAAAWLLGALVVVCIVVLALIVRSSVRHTSNDGRLLIGVLGGLAFAAMFVGCARNLARTRRAQRGEDPAGTAEWMGKRRRTQRRVSQVGTPLVIILAVAALSARGLVLGVVAAALDGAVLAMVPFICWGLIDARRRRGRRGAGDVPPGSDT